MKYNINDIIVFQSLYIFSNYKYSTTEQHIFLCRGRIIYDKESSCFNGYVIELIDEMERKYYFEHHGVYRFVMYYEDDITGLYDDYKDEYIKSRINTL